MINVKFKNPLNEYEILEFPSKSQAIVHLVNAKITKSKIKDILKCTFQHIHIAEKAAKVNGLI